MAQDAKVDEIYEHLEQVYRDSVLGGITAWGQALVKVREDITAPQWDQVYRKLRLTHKAAEMDAAIAVGEGRLDPRLFPDGIAASKILLMPPPAQERLLSGERFKVYMDDGSGEAVALSWLEMSPIQRNRLIGAKSGQILTLAQQNNPSEKKTGARLGTYTSGSYRSGDGYVTLRNGTREARIALSDLAATLGWQEFRKFVQDMQEVFGRNDG